MATDFELQVMAELSEIKSLATAAAAAATAANTAAVAATTAMSDRLFHPQSGVISNLQGDIAEIKDDRKTDQRWERIHNVAHYSLTPLVVGFHAVLRHFGVNV